LRLRTATVRRSVRRMPRKPHFVPRVAGWRRQPDRTHPSTHRQSAPRWSPRSRGAWFRSARAASVPSPGLAWSGPLRGFPAGRGRALGRSAGGAADPHRRLAEVHLGLSRRMRKRQKHIAVADPILPNSILHHCLAAGVAMLVTEALEDTVCDVLLLGRCRAFWSVPCRRLQESNGSLAGTAPASASASGSPADSPAARCGPASSSACASRSRTSRSQRACSKCRSAPQVVSRSRSPSVRGAHSMVHNEAAQLAEAGITATNVETAAQRFASHLATEQPWRDVVAIADDLTAIRSAYASERKRILKD